MNAIVKTDVNTTDATLCECSRYEALVSEQLTEENLASGDYDVYDTACTATTKRTFAPGHDARLKSALIRWGAAGLEVSRVENGLRVSASAEQWADKLNFGYMVRAGIDRAVAKAAARAAKRAASAERKLAEKAGIVTPEPAPVKAKVGRWVYEGTVDGNEFVYADRKSGEAKRTIKFTLI